MDKKGLNRLTATRRRAVDRLLVEYLELEDRQRDGFLRGCKARWPRLYRWLEELAAGSNTVSLLDEAVVDLARRGVESMTDARPVHLMPGQRLGPWEVLEPVGEGGMGMVYRGQRADGAFEMTVAIKLLRLRRAGLSRQLQEESRHLARLNHPGVTRLLDAGLDQDGGPFLVMEWVQGHDLQVWLDEDPPMERRLEVFFGICEAVAHAHRRMMVHGDIKPGNVRLNEEGQVKLMDFGVARLLSGDGTFTKGLEALTPSFAAPEQLEGAPVSIQTDVWSLGAVLYWILTGQVMPRAGAGGKPAGRVARSGELFAIIRKACNVDPEARYSSVRELIADLRRYQGNEPLEALPSGRLNRFGKFVGRNPVLVAGLSATLLVLGIGLVTTSVWYLEAEEARHEAVFERDRAEQHARELAQVVAFQEERLVDIDAEFMGLEMRSRLIEMHRLVSNDEQSEDGIMDAGSSEFEGELAELDFTSYALEVLDQHVFDRTLTAINEQFMDQPVIRARLLQASAETMREVGLIERALAPQEDALEIRREQLGHDHPNTLDSIDHLGLLHVSLGEPDTAMTYLRKALEERRRVLGAEHPDTLASIYHVGTQLFRLGEMDKAEHYYRKALRGRRDQLGSDHPDTLISMISVGSVLRFKGQFDEARPYLETALEGNRRTLGDEHDQTLSSISQLGLLIAGQDRFEEARPYFREVMEARKRIQGGNHPLTLMATRHYGSLLANMNLLEEAKHYLVAAMDGRRQTLGENHPRTLQTVGRVARVLIDLEDPEAAVPYFREVHEGYRQVFGEEHPATVVAISNYSGGLREFGELEESMQFASEAVEISRRALPETHQNLASSLRQKALTLAALERFEESAAAMQEAHSVYEAGIGPQEDQTITAMEDLVSIHRSWHEFDAAAGQDAVAAKWEERLDQARAH